jgi:hypothetical protein
MDFLGIFKNRSSPENKKIRTYDADPLLIVHPDDGVQFFGRMEIQYTPSESEEEPGRAVCLRPAREGWTPVLNVQYRNVLRGINVRGAGRRGGFTFVGEDDDGVPFTWYINKFADDYILSMRDGVAPEELPDESLENELP